MKRKDFDLLRKFMKMTQSDNDNEALTAIRQANKIIERSQVTWDRFFDRAVSVEVEDANAYSDAPAGYGRDAPPKPAPKAWEPGAGVEDASAYAGSARASGFGRDQDPKPQRSYDEPEGDPLGYDDPPPPPSERGGPVIDAAREEDIAEIARAFALLDEVGVPDEAADFINSLRSSFRRRGELTPKQRAALMKFYGNAKKRGLR